MTFNCAHYVSQCEMYTDGHETSLVPVGYDGFMSNTNSLNFCLAISSHSVCCVLPGICPGLLCRFFISALSPSIRLRGQFMYRHSSIYAPADSAIPRLPCKSQNSARFHIFTAILFTILSAIFIMNILSLKCTRTPMCCSSY